MITSSKSRRGIVRVLDEQHLAQWFDGIWGGDMVERGKPHPEMILRAMASVGVTASETLLVGDTTYDIDMGVAAGVQSWGVSWGMHDVARLQAAGATRIIETGEALGA